MEGGPAQRSGQICVNDEVPSLPPCLPNIYQRHDQTCQELDMNAGLGRGSKFCDGDALRSGRSLESNACQGLVLNTWKGFRWVGVRSLTECLLGLEPRACEGSRMVPGLEMIAWQIDKANASKVIASVNQFCKSRHRVLIRLWHL